MYQMKEFLLSSIIVLTLIIGTAQLAAFVTGDSAFVQTLLVVVPCYLVADSAVRAQAMLERQQKRRKVRLMVVAKNQRTAA